jgi:hypothetical protein
MRKMQRRNGATVQRQAVDPSAAPAPVSRKEGRFHHSLTTHGSASYFSTASYLANATQFVQVVLRKEIRANDAERWVARDILVKDPKVGCSLPPPRKHLHKRTGSHSAHWRCYFF